MNRVLIVGGPKSGKRHLLSEVVSLMDSKKNKQQQRPMTEDGDVLCKCGAAFEYDTALDIDTGNQIQSQTSETTTATPPRSSLRFNVVRQTLTTRYYTADIEFYTLRLWETESELASFMNNVLLLSSNRNRNRNHTTTQVSSPDVSDQIHDNFWLGFQSIILVVDLSKEKSFQCVLDFVKTLNALAVRSQYEVSLCIGNRATTTGASQDRLNSWCIENNFELVTLLDTTAASQLAEETTQDSAATSRFVEAHGAARVLEALECNMWPQMDLLPPPPVLCNVDLATLHQSEDDEFDIYNDDTETGSFHRRDVVAITTNENAKDEVTTSSAKITEEEIQTTMTELVNGTLKDNNTNNTENSTANVDSINLNLADNPFLDDFAREALRSTQGDEMDVFDTLMDQIGVLRRESTTLSDSQRRERAAALAIQMFSMMGLDEGGDQENPADGWSSGDDEA